MGACSGSRPRVLALAYSIEDGGLGGSSGVIGDGLGNDPHGKAIVGLKACDVLIGDGGVHCQLKQAWLGGTAAGHEIVAVDIDTEGQRIYGEIDVIPAAVKGCELGFVLPVQLDAVHEGLAAAEDRVWKGKYRADAGGGNGIGGGSIQIENLDRVIHSADIVPVAADLGRGIAASEGGGGQQLGEDGMGGRVGCRQRWEAL